MAARYFLEQDSRARPIDSEVEIMRIAIKIPKGREERFNKLSDVEKEKLKVKCMEILERELR
jgi:hypothetical protein